MDIYLGFDPGGEDHFGWAVCAGKSEPLRIIDTGISNNAKEALEAALCRIPEKGSVISAGIDAPLFWTETGKREIDDWVKEWNEPLRLDA
jgi:hypothetical protein